MLYEPATEHPDHHEEEVVQEGPLGLIEGEEIEENKFDQESMLTWECESGYHPTGDPMLEIESESDARCSLFEQYITEGPNTEVDASSLPSCNWSTAEVELVSSRRVSLELEYEEPEEVLPKEEDIKQDVEQSKGVCIFHKGERDITRSKPPTHEPLGLEPYNMDEHGCQPTSWWKNEEPSVMKPEPPAEICPESVFQELEEALYDNMCIRSCEEDG